MVTRETAGRNLNATGCAARIGTRLGLLLLTLTAVSLLTTPFTQHLWTWDRFLHGGQDFETSALVILTVLNLVLVLSRCCKQNIGKLLTAWKCLCTVQTVRVFEPAGAEAFSAVFERHGVPDPACHFPLLI